MKLKKIFLACILSCGLINISVYVPVKKETTGITSINTGYTILKVRTINSQSQNMIIASSYKGKILAYDFSGNLLWKNELSGFMNHDMWCQDITGNGSDEILVANANGSVYCLGIKGNLMWTFKPTTAPMNAVTVLTHKSEAYVVCGGYDKSIYYLDKNGELVNEISSYSYSLENPWQPYPKPVPDSNCHIANFIRPIKQADGSEALAVHGVIHGMSLEARGSIYLFKPLEDNPYKVIDLIEGRPLGEMRIVDSDNDGNEEIIMGSSTMLQESCMLKIDPVSAEQTELPIQKFESSIDRFGYRVTQPELVTTEGKKTYFILFGSRIILTPLSLKNEKSKILACKYAFNDMWYQAETNSLILASSQSGGSCVHILHLNNTEWKDAYIALQPPGKIQSILENTATIRNNLQTFKKPPYQREQLPVYLITEGRPKSVRKLAYSIDENYNSPIFFNSAYTNKAEKYDRSYIQDDRYFSRRDSRRDYSATSDEIANYFSSKYQYAKGLSFWGGHGNDPYMIQRSTLERILDKSDGKETVLIFPELEDHSHHFEYVLNDYIYPLAESCRQKNAHIFVRTKHSFWFANAYLPMWSRLLSGEFADVFIPAMEETSDKSMELSIAARSGIWASGATEAWGTRCARDNPSFDRLRQHSHQMLPNHFLRMMVYHIASGAQYINNFSVNQEYMSLYWELIAKGALYVPKSSEILSFSPVHLSMLPPDEHFMESSSNIKWTTFYDKEEEIENPMVFNRLTGSWPGAPVTEWDFSHYAAGVKDRRQNFFPNYQHGLVLLTPPQKGVFADTVAPRGALVDNLHPMYKNIMKEFYTDGRYYYSINGKEKFNADTYYTHIEQEIKNSSNLLPVTVEGDVAWIVAQTDSRHLRLTIIDGGYLNPDNQITTVRFNNIHPVNIQDILDKTSFLVSDHNNTEINIPCGGFRFIDIELKETFYP